MIQFIVLVLEKNTQPLTKRSRKPKTKINVEYTDLNKIKLVKKKDIRRLKSLNNSEKIFVFEKNVFRTSQKYFKNRFFELGKSLQNF